jgi:hypothetical protein
MARPSFKYAKYYTPFTVLERLGYERTYNNYQKITRLCRLGVLPEPTTVDPHNNRFFDDEWVERAKKILSEWKH